MKNRFILAILAFSLSSMAALADPSPQAHSSYSKANAATSPIPATAEALVDTAFRAALADGNAQLAASYLSADVLIFEGGHVERSKAEYQIHHLISDIAFARATQYRVLNRAVNVVGDTAWTTTEGQTTGQWRGRAINSMGTETMVMRKIEGQWLIVHIHWSSRNVTAPAAP